MFYINSFNRGRLLGCSTFTKLVELVNISPTNNIDLTGIYYIKDGIKGFLDETFTSYKSEYKQLCIGHHKCVRVMLNEKKLDKHIVVMENQIKFINEI